MADRRKLQGEIERCLKKVSEGVEAFEDIWKKVYNANNTNQKEKYEQDLKREIKKLQRLRDQIKTWMTSSDIKDKSGLQQARKTIETQMERFKVVERETKTKAYSKEGLGAAQKMDPAQRERDDITCWLTACIETLNIQVDKFESDMDSINFGLKKKKNDKEKLDRLDELRYYTDRHKYHIKQLETLLRMLDNGTVDVDQIKRIKEDVEYYRDCSQDEDYQENEFIYEDFELEDLGEYMLKLEGATEGEPKSTATEGEESSAISNSQSTTTTNSPSPSPCLENHSAPPPEITPQQQQQQQQPEVKPVDWTPAPAVAPPASTPAKPPPQPAAPSPAVANNVSPCESSPSPLQLNCPPVINTSTTPNTPFLPNNHFRAHESTWSSSNSVDSPQPSSLTNSTWSDANCNHVVNEQNDQAKIYSPATAKPSVVTPAVPDETASLKNLAEKALLNNVEIQDISNHMHNLNQFAAFQNKTGSAEIDISQIFGKFNKNTYSEEERRALAIMERTQRSLPHPLESVQNNRLFKPSAAVKIPDYYPSSAPNCHSQDFFTRLSTETLFFIFYFLEGTKAQYLAARALKTKSWRFHTMFMMWFQRHEEPNTITDDYEKGTYVYFDFEKWTQRKKEGFVFEYKYLEDKELN